MKKLSHSPSSTPNAEDQRASSWLVEQVYTPKRQRTIALVKRSVEALKQEHQRISLASIAAKSKEVDPEHCGISESAILDNQEARVYYEQHRTWQGNRKRRAKPLAMAVPTSSGAVKPGRDEQRVRQRYLRMGKEELVERLIAVERLHAEAHERWLTQQDEVLTWRLRAQAAETRLKEGKRP